MGSSGQPSTVDDVHRLARAMPHVSVEVGRVLRSLQLQASELLDTETGDRPGDHQLLDLLGALEDVEGVLEPFSEPTPLH